MTVIAGQQLELDGERLDRSQRAPFLWLSPATNWGRRIRLVLVAIRILLAVG
jgi:hypothetical protein